MPLSGFPLLQGMLQKRGRGSPQQQNANPSAFQQMPVTQAPTAPAQYQGDGEGQGWSDPKQTPVAPPAQYSGPVDKTAQQGGTAGNTMQSTFNQQQTDMNKQMPGGKFNRRRF